VAATAESTSAIAISLVAVIFGTINVVGGFVVTDRMLEMFKRRPNEQTGERR
jgi:NAD(P) transhydrogenase subunit alpha